MGAPLSQPARACPRPGHCEKATIASQVTAVQMPTFPSVLAGAAEGGALLAGVAFVEGVAGGWNLPEVRTWIDEHLVEPRWMPRPQTISERPVGVIVLDGGGRDGAADTTRVRNALGAARARVVSSLRGFLSSPCDDRFLHAALFRGRVQRIATESGAEWMPKPDVNDALSDIVLSLFAADMLMRRELYERSLCVCDLCGRVSFDRDQTSARGCPEHVPRTEGSSGFRRWTA
jgi:hypothetical protein